MSSLAPKLAIITGAGSGIGRSLAVTMASSGANVLIVGRTLSKLEETKSLAPDSIHIVQADVSDEAGRKQIADEAAKLSTDVSYLVHNAALLEDACALSEVSPDALRKAISINTEAPILLTQAILPLMKPEARILHISSGAAHGALQGLGVYSVSKAALFMAYQVLKAELAPKGIFVGSVRPGIVATSMQDTIRRADKDKFPDTSAKFHQFHEKMPAEHKVGGAPPTAGLDSADNVAVFLDWLLTGTNNEEFSAEEWDIRDTAHHARWTKA